MATLQWSNQLLLYFGRIFDAISKLHCRLEPQPRYANSALNSKYFAVKWMISWDHVYNVVGSVVRVWFNKRLLVWTLKILCFSSYLWICQLATKTAIDSNGLREYPFENQFPRYKTTLHTHRTHAINHRGYYLKNTFENARCGFFSREVTIQVIFSIGKILL